MQSYGYKKFNKIFSLCLLVQLSAFCFAAANYSTKEFDSIRQELSIQKNKNSKDYIKTKEKLEKFLTKHEINYSDSFRIQDIERLICEQKYDIALWELSELIENNTELSKAYELTADIYTINYKNQKRALEYYKASIQCDKENLSAVYKLAKLYFRENKNVLGIEYLKHIVKKTDNKGLLQEIENLVQNGITPADNFEANNLYEILGLIYVKLNKVQDSYGAFDKAINENNNDIYLKYYFGDLLFENKEDDNALIVYDSILKQNPYDSQIRATKAKILAKKGEILSADKEYMTILDQYPNSNQAKYGIYKLYENKLSIDKILEKINHNKPNYKPTVKEYMAFAKLLEELNDYTGADNCRYYANKLQEASKPKPKPAPALKNKTTKKKIEEERTKKQPILKEKLELEQEKKEEQIIKPPKEQPKEEVHSEVSKNAKKYPQYQVILDKYLSIENKDASIYIAIANTYKLMEDPYNALKNYKKALKLAPQNSDIYYNIGLTYMELNSNETAKSYLNKSISLNNDNTKAKKLLAFVDQKLVTKLLNKAYSAYENKRYVEAFDTLNEGLKTYPDNAQIYYYRALVCDAMNRNAAQIIDLQKAIELDPSFYMAYYQLGKAYEKINDERSALVIYEKFLSIEPEEKELIKEVQKKVLILGKKYY